jgi:tRNA pseudouridine13 synthase
MRGLPYLTGPVAAIAGAYKSRWEDFSVQELPRFEPEGRGDHTWFEVEKRGLTTATAAGDLARSLGVAPSSVGYAGMKDSRSISRQWMSVEHVDPDRVLAVAIPRVRVLRATRHPRKLRRGWHAGNAFEIRLRPGSRDVVSWPGGDAPGAVRARLALLERRGVPNYYGPQRFGTRGDTWRIGRALAREEWAEAAALIAGRPLPEGASGADPAAGIHPDRDDILRARELFDQGRYVEAASTWPAGYGQCARLAAAMARTDGDAARSLAAVGKRMLRLYAEAYQSWLFNHVVARRIETIDRVMPGDLAWKHDTESLFVLPDPAIEQARAERFEISATGPLVGRRLRVPESEAGAVEWSALEDAGFRTGDLESAALRPLSGRRRPLRFLMREAHAWDGVDEHGPFLEVRFVLPPGCYATAVLRELGHGRIVERSSGSS